MMSIDGAMGEGGGQILRSSLALSLCLRKPFRIFNIRKTRKRPGLMRQHLAAVKAAAQISNAETHGVTLGAQELTFIPHAVNAGHYRFAIGTAGSTTLLLQTLLPPLLIADHPTQLILEGGTHNPNAPPFDFMSLAFLPLINRMGPTVTVTLERPGFYPVGGGRIKVEIHPCTQLASLHLLERRLILDEWATALVVNLPVQIAQRELRVIGPALGMGQDRLEVQSIHSAKGPGNVVMVMIKSQALTEVFTGFGMRGVRAETVATKVVKKVQRYLKAGVPVGENLADQFLLPLSLAGGGSFMTVQPSPHTETNIAVIKKFMDTTITCHELGPDRWRISVGEHVDHSIRSC